MSAQTSPAVTLPVAWEVICAALAQDPRWTLALRTGFRQVERIRRHGRVYRISFASGGGMASLILKLATPREGRIHARIAREMNNIVPEVYGLRPASSDDGLTTILMEDLGPIMICAAGSLSAPVGIPQQREAYGRAARSLAAVHNRFDGQCPGLPAFRTIDNDLTNAGRDIPRLLDLLTALGMISLDQTTIAEIQNIAAALDEHVMRCSSAGGKTLIHGDFHLANIMIGRNGEVRILDWGASGAGFPEWDLVMCDEAQVFEYLEVRSFRSGQDDRSYFYQNLRSAVVLRMYEFLRASIGIIFGDEEVGDADMEPLLISIPMYAKRLVEAANAGEFHGGEILGSGR